MNAREQGFLLLTSHLGDLRRPALTVAQMRLLIGCVRESDLPREDRHVLPEDLMTMGYNRPSAERIIQLLSEQERLADYLQKGARAGCVPITRVTPGYPRALIDKLGLECPGCLWARGDRNLLGQPGVALVGSRELRPENAAFAREVGRQAALQGYVLISGNARGADTEAQESCLAHGGRAISIIADSLYRQPLRKNLLYLSEDGFDLRFTAARALSRNRLIHSLGALTLVAQCRAEKGGSWDGSVKNLRGGWTPLLCFDDGSTGAAALMGQGARPVGLDALSDLAALHTTN